ncbi:MAG: sigma-70 family RNA polymerase sigma factor [Kineosporiaceae bacterium]
MRETEPHATRTRPASSGRQGPVAADLTASELLKFEEFYRTHHKKLMTHVMYAGGTWHEAESAVATALADLWKRWPDIDSPTAYAKLSAIRNLVSTRKREARNRQLEKAAVEHPDNALRRTVVQVSVWEDRNWVTWLLNGLPPRQAEVLAFIYDGLNTKEISELLGTSDDAVRQALSKARQSVRSTLRAQSEPAADAQKRTSSGDEER